MLCLFDLDGTLIDSEHGITACVKHALARLDVPAPAHAELRRWIGPPLRHSFAPLLDNDAERIEAAVEYYHERFNTLGWREHEIYPGIEALIERLRGAVAARSADDVRRAAHALKGSVSNFIDGGPTATAFELETMGRNGQLDGTSAVLDRLEQEIVALTVCLQDFQAKGTGSAEGS